MIHIFLFIELTVHFFCSKANRYVWWDNYEEMIKDKNLLKIDFELLRNLMET
jgi:hypothetical protein